MSVRHLLCSKLNGCEYLASLKNKSHIIVTSTLTWLSRNSLQNLSTEVLKLPPEGCNCILISTFETFAVLNNSIKTQFVFLFVAFV